MVLFGLNVLVRKPKKIHGRNWRGESSICHRIFTYHPPPLKDKKYFRTLRT
jgi:hypothetical protein